MIYFNLCHLFFIKEVWVVNKSSVSIEVERDCGRINAPQSVLNLCLHVQVASTSFSSQHRRRMLRKGMTVFLTVSFPAGVYFSQQRKCKMPSYDDLFVIFAAAAKRFIRDYVQ